MMTTRMRRTSGSWGGEGGKDDGGSGASAKVSCTRFESTIPHPAHAFFVLVKSIENNTIHLHLLLLLRYNLPR